MKLPVAFLGSCLLASSFSPAFADDIKTGHFDLTYTTAYALGLAAAPRYEQYDSNCKELVASTLNTQVSVDYEINTRTNYQYLYYTYAGTRLLLSSMGLSSAYSFITSASRVPALNDLGNVRNVFFKMDLNFQNPSSSFNIIFPTEGHPEFKDKFQCVVTTASSSK